MDGLPFCSPIPVAGEDATALYLVDLDAGNGTMEAFETYLSPSERAHVARLVRPEQRRRVSASRGALRAIVAAHLGRPEDQVEITRDARGKPHAGTGAPGVSDCLKISCSRSGGLAAIAVSRRYEIGIDVEVPTEMRFPDSLAEFILSPAERAAYANTAPAMRTIWLARAWVRKEALLKGIGCGLELEPGAINTVAQTDNPRGGRSTWSSYRAGGFPRWRLRDVVWEGSVIGIATQPAAHH